ncbi:unnamed protein product [Trypanosoma congolense IL3000]|uniref:WGS project CAEQ00000000 data, annotated contig 2236 n=1 Tax=Trypanosoma congolense (strain IL3000) TaxID=1068625 RepID=F9WCI6_TRYCI|nr:unnamed protein product [Trypanosoma congolense IL3000]
MTSRFSFICLPYPLFIHLQYFYQLMKKRYYLKQLYNHVMSLFERVLQLFSKMKLKFVKGVIMVLVLLLPFKPGGVRKSNEQGLRLLCSVLRASEIVFKGYRGNRIIEEAFYGREGGVRLRDGSVHLGWACSGKSLRTQLCTLFNGIDGLEGSFAESFVGITRFVCTPWGKTA